MSSDTEIAEIWEVTKEDRRKELIGAITSGVPYLGQKLTGEDVEYFDPDTGFVLLRKNTSHSPYQAYIRRASACAQLSLGVPLELREFYYTIRQTPNLVEAFSSIKPEGIYAAVLDSINDLEILADVDRADFTMGNLSKGFIFDAHSWSYNDRGKKIGFTEKIAMELLQSYEIARTQNIIVVEKNSAATRLVELGLSELTNSMIVTVGGNFNRAIWSLIERFRGEKNILCLCDADVYGDDMLRGVEFGTMNSRHLPFKFPPSQNPNLHLVGLFPSVGERLELPNDVEQKRPLNNPYAKTRLEFLKRYNLVDQRDIDTWERNKTYELEGLSTTFKNDKGEPAGIAILLIEYMRLMNLNIKPPLPSDEELKEEFDKEAKEELRSEIDSEVGMQSPLTDLQTMLERLINDKISEIVDDIYDEHIEAYEDALKEVGAKEIKFHINEQFRLDPTRDTYDLKAIAHKLKTEFDIDVGWNKEEIMETVRNALTDYIAALAETLWNATIKFAPIHNETKLQDIYDMALAKIGAKPEDAEKVREALRWRFGNDPRISERKEP